MKKDLIVLAPDKNTKFTVNGILTRYQSLKIRKIDYDIFVHPKHDPGIYNDSVNFLRAFLNQYNYTLVFIDKEGSGQDKKKSTDELANIIKTNLEKNGWEDRVEVIVFNPELEIWVWVDSPHTAVALGWNNYEELKNYLMQKEFWQINSPKPKKPKEAMELLLKIKLIPRSSSIYQEIAEKANFAYCVEPSFLKFKRALTSWFKI
jgi:hypothetical protein